MFAGLHPGYEEANLADKDGYPFSILICHISYMLVVIIGCM